jgi:hypothetical protein
MCNAGVYGWRNMATSKPVVAVMMVSWVLADLACLGLLFSVQ